MKKDFCGLASGKLDLTLLDEIVHQNIPAGAAVRKKPHAFVKQLDTANFFAPISITPSEKVFFYYNISLKIFKRICGSIYGSNNKMFLTY